MFISFYRIIKFSFQNFWRNIWLSLVAISMLYFMLLCVNALLAFNVLTQKAVHLVEDKVEVAVYFKTDVETSRAKSTAEYLRNLSQVRSVDVATADEVLARFKTRHATEETVLQSLDEIGRNPFGPSLVIKARDVSDFPFILDILNNPQFEQDIRDKNFNDYRALVTSIRSTTDRINMLCLGLTALFLLIAVLVIINTVRIAIFIHREEIGIMKLVGATDRFVRIPYQLEAVMFSLIATGLAAATVFPIIAATDPRLAAFLGGVSSGILPFYKENALIIFASQAGALALINMVTTSFAMRRYLKV